MWLVGKPISQCRKYLAVNAPRQRDHCLKPPIAECIQRRRQHRPDVLQHGRRLIVGKLGCLCQGCKNSRLLLGRRGSAGLPWHPTLSPRCWCRCTIASCRWRPSTWQQQSELSRLPFHSVRTSSGLSSMPSPLSRNGGNSSREGKQCVTTCKPARSRCVSWRAPCVSGGGMCQHMSVCRAMLSMARKSPSVGFEGVIKRLKRDRLQHMLASSASSEMQLFPAKPVLHG